MQDITKLERDIIEAITESDFYENGPDSVVWVDTVSTALGRQAMGGVLSSLVQKGFIRVEEYERGSMVVSFTEEGKGLLELLQAEREGDDSVIEIHGYRA